MSMVPMLEHFFLIFLRIMILMFFEISLQDIARGIAR